MFYTYIGIIYPPIMIYIHIGGGIIFSLIICTYKGGYNMLPKNNVYTYIRIGISNNILHIHRYLITVHP